MMKNIYKYNGKEYTNITQLAKDLGKKYQTVYMWFKRDSIKIEEHGIEVIEFKEWHGYLIGIDGTVRKKNFKPVVRTGRQRNQFRYRKDGEDMSIGIANVVYHCFMDKNFDPFNPAHRISFLEHNNMTDCSIENIAPTVKTMELLDKIELEEMEEE